MCENTDTQTETERERERCFTRSEMTYTTYTTTFVIKRVVVFFLFA